MFQFRSDLVPYSLSPYKNKVDVIGPDPIAWFKTGQFVAAATGVHGLITWCSRCIGKSLTVVRDHMVPHHWYRQELEKMFERLDGLERELQQLRNSRPEQMGTASVAHSAACPHCHCPKCGKAISGVGTASTVTIPTGGVPPPPPPPPPVKLCVPTYTRTRKRINSSKEEKRTRPTVTLDQLLQVKLRHADPRPPLREENDLENIHDPVLKQRVLKTVLSQDNENVQDMIASEVLSFKGCLKKTTMKRSPGGTPLVKRRKQNGKGLTPMMAKALKRKFLCANDSRSSSDSSMDGSPSPRQRLSPSAGTPDCQPPSPNPQSPLTDSRDLSFSTPM